MELNEEKDGIFLIHGNSLEVVPELRKEFGDHFADCIITDPPYGCKLPGQRDFHKDIPSFDGEQMWGELVWPVVKEDGAVLMFNEEMGAARLICTGIQWFRYFYAVDSLKSRGHLNCGRRPMLRNILIEVFYKKQPTYNAQLDSPTSGGTHMPTDMLYIVPTGKKEIYPHERNVGLLEHLVKTYTNEGDLVFDFCMGAGSLAEACYNTGRKFIGIELIDDTYEKVVNRIANL